MKRSRPERIVILGAGGHAREVLEILRTCQAQGEPIEPIGFIDENPQNHGRTIDGLPVLGDFGWFYGVDIHDIAVICALGNPKVARKLVHKAKSLGVRFTNAISPRAWISPRALVGRGVIIFPNVIVNTGASIGDFVTLNVAVTVSHDTVVGDFCNINPGAHLAGNVQVQEGCYIGMGAHVIQGITIGEWSVIGAGAVVIRDIPPHVTAVGVPAKVIKHHEKEEPDETKARDPGRPTGL